MEFLEYFNISSVIIKYNWLFGILWFYVALKMIYENRNTNLKLSIINYSLGTIVLFSLGYHIVNKGLNQVKEGVCYSKAEIGNFGKNQKTYGNVLEKKSNTDMTVEENGVVIKNVNLKELMKGHNVVLEKCSV